MFDSKKEIHSHCCLGIMILTACCIMGKVPDCICGINGADTASAVQQIVVQCRNEFSCIEERRTLWRKNNSRKKKN